MISSAPCFLKTRAASAACWAHLAQDVAQVAFCNVAYGLAADGWQDVFLKGSLQLGVVVGAGHAIRHPVSEHRRQGQVLCSLLLGLPDSGFDVGLGVDAVGALFENEEEGDAAVKTIQRSGFASFLYLEVLDASFSFDGVIGAFAITKDVVIIMLGLAIGAMFVRSLTVFLVEKGTMSELKYLENGAFFGIAWLVCTMFLSAYGINFGEIVVAGVAAGTILLSGLHSWFIRHQHNASEQ